METLSMNIDISPQTLTARAALFREELDWLADARNDLQAFKPLYEKYYEKVYLFVFRRCAENEDCLDITSRVFEKAMLHIRKYEFKGFAFSTWLYRIAQNELADYFRKQNRDRKLWVHDEGLTEIVQEINDDDTSESRLKAVIEALKLLNREDCELMVMRYFEKYSYEEIAATLDTNVNQLRVRIHRIHKKIKTDIERNNTL